MAATAAWGMARIAACAAAAASLAACASLPAPRSTMQSQGAYAPQKIGAPYQVGGIWYVPREQPGYDEVGTASWYGEQFHLKSTANGEIFDMNGVSAAHTTLPLPCIVEVTNLDNGRKLRVRVNDRGPFVGGRIIDLSRAAARELGYERAGLARVRVRYIGAAPLLGPEAGVRMASARPPPASTASYASLSVPQASASWASASPTWGSETSSSQTSSSQASATLRWHDQQPAWPYGGSTAPTMMTAAAAPPAPAAPVTIQNLPPLAPAAATEPSPDDIPIAQADPPPSGYQIQAGAFSQEARARSVAAQLSDVGEAVVEPVQRGGVTLYRVVLPAPSDELQAYNLRHRVSEAGFADARVVPSNRSF